jgi:hypothetical protein
MLKEESSTPPTVSLFRHLNFFTLYTLHLSYSTDLSSHTSHPFNQFQSRPPASIEIMAPAVRRPIRIGGASGGFSDRVRAITSLAQNEDVDIIVGDWLSEMTMTIHGSGKQRALAILSKEGGKKFDELDFEQQLQTAMFAENFMDCFEPAIPFLAERGIKLAVNAGASDTEVLAKLVKKKVEEKGYGGLKVAWIEGDEQTNNVRKLIKEGEGFESLMHGRSIKDWENEIVCAQCYLGGLGIAEALRQGADIVIAGRVADAAPTVGAAA